MMLAHTFKLLGLFLSLSILASAAPVDTDIDIVASSPAVLFRRLSRKEKRKCPYPSVWRYRECDLARGPRAYHDVCAYRGEQPAFAYVRKECPENHICVPVPVDADGDQSIDCVQEDDSSSDSGSPRRKKAKTGEAQTGTSTQVTAAPGPQNTEEEWESYINWDIPEASVTAEFLSTDGSFVVAPSKMIVGKIKGTNTKVCEGNKSSWWKSRTCYPFGTHDLKMGMIIAFTYAITHGQSGFLHWAAIPRVHDELRKRDKESSSRMGSHTDSQATLTGS